MNPSHLWTPEDDAALRAAYRDPSRDAVKRIAERLGRSYAATRMRAGLIGARRTGLHRVLRESVTSEKATPVSPAYKTLHRARAGVRAERREGSAASNSAADAIRDAFLAWHRPEFDA